VFCERIPLTQSVQALVGEACVDLLRAYQLELRAGPTWQESDEVLYSGVMSFVGDTLRGTCLLAAPESVILGAAPSGAAARDWIGELANQLVGRLKAKLLGRGARIALSTPVVLRGVRLCPLPRTGVAPMAFESDRGRLFVWVEVEARDDVDLREPHTPVAAEGDLLVF
jgi:hypothetical protein